MAPYALEILKARRLTAIIQELDDRRNLPAELRFLNRTPVVPATDGEILARWSGYMQIADIVSDDAQALTYASGKLTYEATNVPNLKHGVNFTQEQLNQLQALSERGVERDEAMVLDWVNRSIDGLLLGVRWRMEALLVAAATDSIAYDRFGLKLNGTFGMPTDLKVTVAVAWQANPTTATPVSDIWALRLVGRTRYGQEYNRLTMSTPAFQAMIATTEFQNKARMYMAPNVSFVNLNAADLTAMQNLANNVLGMQIELYDARYWSQAANGALTSAPFLALNQVVLSFTGDDNNAGARDFANAIVTESIVDSLTGGNVLGGMDPQRGPLAYAIPNQTLNPPTITMWAVARGFPRKHRRTETAVLNIGAVTDAISPSAPF